MHPPPPTSICSSECKGWIEKGGQTRIYKPAGSLPFPKKKIPVSTYKFQISNSKIPENYRNRFFAGAGSLISSISPDIWYNLHGAQQILISDLYMTKLI